jgi:hypothetical protein
VFVLAALCFSLQGAAQTEPGCCKIPQSPRKLLPADYNYTSTVPTVRQGTSNDSIRYSPRAGVEMTLHRCSQHYHCRIENVQACPFEVGHPGQPVGGACQPPKVGDVVEIHTAYHAGPLRTPTPENLTGCTDGPIVVVGYHATLTATGHPGIPVYFGPESAEWSGSTTNEDNTPNECKPAVFWSFALGCHFEVGLKALQTAFTHPDAVRALQTGDRVSKDLTHIVAPKKP